MISPWFGRMRRYPRTEGWRARRGDTVVLYYTFRGISSWVPITSDRADGSGNYSVTWTPPATGDYVLRAEWAGNATHGPANSTAGLSTGQAGTRGYARITVAKSLIPNSSRVGVYVDWVEKGFSMLPMDDSWVLALDYPHSAHRVMVYLDVTLVPEFPGLMILPLFMLLSAVFAALARKRVHFGARPRTLDQND